VHGPNSCKCANISTAWKRAKVGYVQRTGAWSQKAADAKYLRRAMQRMKWHKWHHHFLHHRCI
jgi:hypothetical protein